MEKQNEVSLLPKHGRKTHESRSRLMFRNLKAALELLFYA